MKVKRFAFLFVLFAIMGSLLIACAAQQAPEEEAPAEEAPAEEAAAEEAPAEEAPADGEAEKTE